MEQMSAAVTRLEEISGSQIKEWAVTLEKGKYQHGYAILIETADGKDLSNLSEQFEEILRDVNPLYRFYEGNNLIDPPVIWMQKPGSHQEWWEKKVAAGASADQVKPVKILDTPEKEDFFRERIQS